MNQYQYTVLKKMQAPQWLFDKIEKEQNITKSPAGQRGTNKMEIEELEKIKTILFVLVRNQILETGKRQGKNRDEINEMAVTVIEEMAEIINIEKGTEERLLAEKNLKEKQ